MIGCPNALAVVVVVVVVVVVNNKYVFAANQEFQFIIQTIVQM